MALPLALALEWFSPAWLPAGIALAALLLGVTQGFDFSAQFLSSTLQARRYGRLYILKAVLALGLGVAALKLGAGVWGVIGAMVASYIVSCAVSAPDAARCGAGVFSGANCGRCRAMRCRPGLRW